jgi:hypothetical protein
MSEILPQPAPVSASAYEQSLRTVGEVLCIWRLCGRTSCRRARACRGLPRECLPRYAPLVPMGARNFVVGILNAREFGYSPEEAVANHAEESEALAAWIAAVDGANRAARTKCIVPSPTELGNTRVRQFQSC